ncbi:hypothetical protein K437DRAFT_107248 [Tilletiaria anomala UBC 951]|uniref:Uncharacterized protein n=1 Tax=Tilletiaria anomala (strain ATCC 24038 / CBS 436.72 / UBC 951) TaxID=1037660 RepID=A0A066VXL6_TILAU|nr:uncharacterized protein K437DRAFT_107248 [Tilletiaria anomala UBC 951]KDN46447.1 hypothetical protein K437DRAFT_107248 [Tilletiaria anomala UBC 951]
MKTTAMPAPMTKKAISTPLPKKRETTSASQSVAATKGWEASPDIIDTSQASAEGKLEVTTYAEASAVDPSKNKAAPEGTASEDAELGAAAASGDAVLGTSKGDELEDPEATACEKIKVLKQQKAERPKKDTAVEKRKTKEKRAELKRVATRQKQQEKQERKAKERKQKEELIAKLKTEKQRAWVEKEAAKSAAAAKKRAEGQRKKQEIEERRKIQAEKDAERKARKEQHDREKRVAAEKAKGQKKQLKDIRKMATAAALVEVAAWHAKEVAEANEDLQAVKAQKARISSDFRPVRAAITVERSSTKFKSKSARISVDATRPSPKTDADKVRRRKSVKSQCSAAEKGKGRALDVQSVDNSVADPNNAEKAAVLVEAEIAGAKKENNAHPQFSPSKTSISRESTGTARSSTVTVINPSRGGRKPAPAVQWRKPEDY